MSSKITTKDEQQTADYYLVQPNDACSLLNDLRYCLMKQKGDITFKLNRNNKLNDEKELHSSILQARSAFIRRAYNHYKLNDGSLDLFQVTSKNDLSIEAEEENKGNIRLTIDGLNNLQVLQDFVKFIYSSLCDITSTQQALDLLKCANVFEIKSLKDKISDYFISKLIKLNNDANDDLENVIKLLELAYNNELTKLEDNCIDIINRKSNIVIHMASWNKLTNSNPLLLAKFIQKK